MIDSENLAMFEDNLAADLVRHCAEGSYMPAGGTMLLTTVDFEDKWAELVRRFIADAVPSFNEYPEYTLACAFYAGAATAVMWDRDWAVLSGFPYEALLGSRGFDNMDDHIAEHYLGFDPLSDEGVEFSSLASSLSGICISAIRHAPIEPQTSDALRVLASCLKCMFLTGASVELYSLGYSMQKVTPDRSLS